jgi:AraC-like DNA-binding protein
VTVGSVVQMAPGLLECDSTDVAIRSLRFRRLAYNVGIRGTIETGKSRVVLAYLPRQHGVARINGELWLNHRLAVVRGSAEFCSERAFVLILVEVEAKQIPAFQKATTQHSVDEWCALLPAGDRLALRLQSRVDEVVDEPEPIGLPATAIESRLVASIGLTLDRAMLVKSATNKHENGRAMANAAQGYMWSHVDDDIGLEEICRGIGCHRRTLLNYFNRLYGMSPIRFLKILRLNRAQKALRESDPLRISIFDVAADHGFWHMGHFSSDYRSLFGETPSETLESKVPV